MPLILAGTVRVPADKVESLRPHAVAMMAATRAEDGCIAYAFSEDVGDRGLIHVFEIWRDREALAAHGASEHMRAWRAAAAQVQMGERNLSLYEIASEQAL